LIVENLLSLITFSVYCVVSIIVCIWTISTTIFHFIWLDFNSFWRRSHYVLTRSDLVFYNFRRAINLICLKIGRLCLSFFAIHSDTINLDPFVSFKIETFSLIIRSITFDSCWRRSSTKYSHLWRFNCFSFD
jgi:hypothetical protein